MVCGLGAINNGDVEKRNRTSINFDMVGITPYEVIIVLQW